MNQMRKEIDFKYLIADENNDLINISKIVDHIYNKNEIDDIINFIENLCTTDKELLKLYKLLKSQLKMNWGESPEGYLKRHSHCSYENIHFSNMGMNDFYDVKHRRIGIFNPLTFIKNLYLGLSKSCDSNCNFC